MVDVDSPFQYVALEALTTTVKQTCRTVFQCMYRQAVQQARAAAATADSNSIQAASSPLGGGGHPAPVAAFFDRQLQHLPAWLERHRRKAYLLAQSIVPKGVMRHQCIEALQTYQRHVIPGAAPDAPTVPAHSVPSEQHLLFRVVCISALRPFIADLTFVLCDRDACRAQERRAWRLTTLMLLQEMARLPSEAPLGGSSTRLPPRAASRSIVNPAPAVASPPRRVASPSPEFSSPRLASSSSISDERSLSGERSSIGSEHGVGNERNGVGSERSGIGSETPRAVSPLPVTAISRTSAITDATAQFHSTATDENQRGGDEPIRLSQVFSNQRGEAPVFGHARSTAPTNHRHTFAGQSMPRADTVAMMQLPVPPTCINSLSSVLTAKKAAASAAPAAPPRDGAAAARPSIPRPSGHKPPRRIWKGAGGGKPPVLPALWRTKRNA